MATNAGEKVVRRGIEKPAGIGTQMVVIEINNVLTFTNIHMVQEEHTPVSVEAKALLTEEDHIPE